MNRKRIYLTTINLEKELCLNLPKDISYSTLTDSINKFESKVGNILKAPKRCLALNSGTSAIHLALLCANIGKGDEVFCQSLTFAASANPIVYVGARPIFIDSEKNTWNMCPVSLKMAYYDRVKKGKKPKAIILTSLYGMPYDYDIIREFARNEDLLILDDSAEAFGSSYKGLSNGTLGDYGVISFNNNKIISALGGGILVFKNAKEKERGKFLSTQAKEKRIFYHHKEIGYNYKISYLNALLGYNQLDHLQNRISEKLEIYKFYESIFSKIPGCSLQKAPSDSFVSNRWICAVIINTKKTLGIKASDLYDAFAKGNIESRPLWKPMHLQPVFKTSLYYGGKVAEELFENGLCLPSGPNLSKEDRNRIETIIFTLFKKNLNPNAQ